MHGDGGVCVEGAISIRERGEGEDGKISRGKGDDNGGHWFLREDKQRDREADERIYGGGSDL